MDKSYVIVTDNTNDLPDEMLKANSVDTIFLTYELDGVRYNYDNQLSSHDFYEGMREGKGTKTSASNPVELKEAFGYYLEKGLDVLFICISSGISSTAGNAFIAKNDLEEKYPERKVKIIDSLCASGGQGMLVYRAIKNYNSGMSLEDNYSILETEKLNVVHKFTVEDLKYLQRGGRISKATATIGTLINIKPLLHVDMEGKLVAESKARGRRKSLQQLVTSMGDCMGSWNDRQDTIIVAHGDSLEDAQYCVDLIKERYNPKEIILTGITPTIGAHTGPGVLALFCMGDVR